MSWKSRRNGSMRKRRNNMSMRRRRNNVTMRRRQNNLMGGNLPKPKNWINCEPPHYTWSNGTKHCEPEPQIKGGKRRNNMTMRRNNMLRRMMYGGYDSTPAPTQGNSMASMQAQSLAQGQQFDALHKNQHGGGLDAGPFPGAVVAPTVLPENLHASARVAPLDAAIKEIQGLKDQSGGRRRRRRGSKKSRKGRKGRKQRGGAWTMGNEQSVNASGMLLPGSLEAKALSGMNAEWKLAENPKAFAPGYASY